ncbi:KH domain-containing protein [Salix suchowensis]|nr:KH domain-containing protein [Salix suchowensis]
MGASSSGGYEPLKSGRCDHEPQSYPVRPAAMGIPMHECSAEHLIKRPSSAGHECPAEPRSKYEGTAEPLLHDCPARQCFLTTTGGSTYPQGRMHSDCFSCDIILGIYVSGGAILLTSD